MTKALKFCLLKYLSETLPLNGTPVLLTHPLFLASSILHISMGKNVVLR